MATANAGTAVKRWNDDEDLAFVSFSLGPVQSFIEAARSVRDLWTGSYLLSYLTFRAMQPILTRDGRQTDLVFPAVEELPLWKHEHRRADVERPSPDPDSPLMPCIPNKFVAVVNAEEAGRLAAECENACHRAWREIAGRTRVFIEGRIRDLPHVEGWDARRWDSQVETFFEVRTLVLPWQAADPETLKEWVDAESLGSSLWAARMELLSRLLEARRSIRHVPSYFPGGPVPQKCTLLGTYEQMGPARLAECREFWRRFAEKGPYDGTRTDRNERLCAVSLVKRFAWPAFFAKQWGLDPAERRFPDTATIAAARWLSHDDPLNPDDVWKQERRWSGQWLHWKSQDEGKEDGERPVSDRVWRIIGAKKRNPEHPPLPTYYAVLVLDGDRMGDWVQGRYKTRDGRPLPPGEVIQSTISRALGRFAVERARGIVEGLDPGHQGTLVYSGGDDVLAMLPTETVLNCARRFMTHTRRTGRRPTLSPRRTQPSAPGSRWRITRRTFDSCSMRHGGPRKRRRPAAGTRWP